MDSQKIVKLLDDVRALLIETSSPSSNVTRKKVENLIKLIQNGQISIQHREASFDSDSEYTTLDELLEGYEFAESKELFPDEEGKELFPVWDIPLVDPTRVSILATELTDEEIKLIQEAKPPADSPDYEYEVTERFFKIRGSKAELQRATDILSRSGTEKTHEIVSEDQIASSNRWVEENGLPIRHLSVAEALSDPKAAEIEIDFESPHNKMTL